MAEEQSKIENEKSKHNARPLWLGDLIYMLARGIGTTLDVEYRHYERIEEATKRYGGAILVTWHGRTLLPANVFRGLGYWALISLSKDGEVQNHIFHRFGFQTIRGSTGRGGVRAALQLAKKIQEGGVLAFTPDGPRGPSHKVQQGTIFLAQRSGCPIIPIGTSASSRWLLKSWDRYMIPRPFARTAFVVGEPLLVPAELDEEGKEQVAQALECAMNACEREAEAMMGHG